MSIKTWRDRYDSERIGPEAAMQAENKELRAELDKLESGYTDQVLRAMKAEEALDKLKKQEPVGYLATDSEGNIGISTKENIALRYCEAGTEAKPLYLAAGAQPQAELTDDELIAILEPLISKGASDLEISRAVLAAQKGKQ